MPKPNKWGQVATGRDDSPHPMTQTGFNPEQDTSNTPSNCNTTFDLRANEDFANDPSGDVTMNSTSQSMQKSLSYKFQVTQPKPPLDEDKKQEVQQNVLHAVKDAFMNVAKDMHLNPQQQQDGSINTQIPSSMNMKQFNTQLEDSMNKNLSSQFGPNNNQGVVFNPQPTPNQQINPDQQQQQQQAYKTPTPFDSLKKLKPPGEK